ncbi:NAD-dependent epimerase/dehydratase family protein, partial [bacterium]|nr:NAD-dependent epimerase/dehydratase family protein [bacterium]
IDSLNNAYDVKLKEKRLEELNKKENFLFLNNNLSEKNSLDEVKKHELTTFYHLAARAGVRQSFLDPNSYIEDNTLATTNISNFCKEMSVQDLILASTSSIYGDSGENLMVEEKDEKIKPPSVYASTKLSGESLSKIILEDTSTNLIISRFFTVYGPFGRPDMSILRFIHWIINEEKVQVFGDGEQRRSFTYVKDVVDALLKMSGLEKSHTFNVGSNMTVSLNDVIKLIEEYSGRNAKIENLERAYKDPDVVRPNLENIKKIIGWEPTTKIEEGVEKTVAWYKKNEEYLKDLVYL